MTNKKKFIDEMGRFNVIAKARQIGFSTMSLALCLWMAMNRPRTNYMIVSYKQESSTSLFDKLKMMYDDLPHDKFKFPKDVQNNRGQMKFDNGSSITLATAGVKMLVVVLHMNIFCYQNLHSMKIKNQFYYQQNKHWQRVKHQN